MSVTLFAYQVFHPVVGSLRADLHRAIAAAPVRASAAARRLYHGHIAALLLPAAPSLVRGNWDYTDDAREAEAEYETWCRGTVLDARERPRVSGPPGELRYFFVTLLLLLERGSADDRRLEQATLAPAPGEHWRRGTFVALLEALRSLDFEATRSEAVYLCPGVDDHGLTPAELAAPRYAYLHTIE